MICARKRLGRRDPDLRSGPGVEDGVASRGICAPLVLQMASTRAFCCLACRTASSVSAVSPDWRDRHDQRGAVQHRVAVAELTSELDLDGQPGPVLDGVLRQQAGVVGGAAGDDEDLVDLAQVLVGQPLLVEHDPAVDEVAQQAYRRPRSAARAISLSMK